jgi:glycine cleavage system H protein
MQENPEYLKYTESHEWVSLDGNIATVGITHHAQAQMGDLVYIELPEVGDVFDQGEEIVVVESVKTASDVYCPMSGKIIEVNKEALETPEMINEQPYAEGWLVKIEVEKPEQLDDFMNAEEYTETSQD